MPKILEFADVTDRIAGQKDSPANGTSTTDSGPTACP